MPYQSPVFISYAESQRRKMCPYDRKVGTRSDIQRDQIFGQFIEYNCPDGHIFQVDIQYELEIPQSEQVELLPATWQVWPECFCSKEQAS